MTDHKKEIVFIGGDMRMAYAAEYMSESFDCSLVGFDKTDNVRTAAGGKKYDMAVLPVFSGDTKEIRCPLADRAYDISILPALLKEGGIVFAGRPTPELRTLCDNSSYELYDYLEREELAVSNAVLTAEGALETAIRATPRSIHDANVLILGFGRIGKICAGYFSALGADVSAAARKKRDIAWIAAGGYRPVDLTDENAVLAALSEADIILNTAPAKLITAQRDAAVREDAVLIELASVPCTGEDTHIHRVKAGGLPGKTAPVTAGEIIASAVENILSERSRENG